MKFTDSLREIFYWAGNIARARGYFDHPMPYLVLTLTNRVVEELQEFSEVYARGKAIESSDKIPYSKAEEEWADIVIKALRIGAVFGFNLNAICAKLNYEETRVPQRGGKQF